MKQSNIILALFAMTLSTVAMAAEEPTPQFGIFEYAGSCVFTQDGAPVHASFFSDEDGTKKEGKGLMGDLGLELKGALSGDSMLLGAEWKYEADGVVRYTANIAFKGKTYPYVDASVNYTDKTGKIIIYELNSETGLTTSETMTGSCDMIERFYDRKPEQKAEKKKVKFKLRRTTQAQ